MTSWLDRAPAWLFMGFVLVILGAASFVLAALPLTFLAQAVGLLGGIAFVESLRRPAIELPQARCLALPRST